MSALVAVLTVVLLGVVILVVSAPLLAARREPDPASTADRADLQAAREAKYREIRDAELDYRTGKLSAEDYAAIDGTLRAEAVEILDRLAALGDEAPGRALVQAQGRSEQEDRVQHEQDREEDRPAVEVALDHRAPAERTLTAADPESAGQTGVFAGVHQHEEDQDHADRDLDEGEDRFHGLQGIARGLTGRRRWPKRSRRSGRRT